MKRVQGAMVLLVALMLAAWQATAVQAQAAKTARGTVTAVSGDSLTVKVGEKFGLRLTSMVMPQEEFLPVKPKEQRS